MPRQLITSHCLVCSVSGMYESALLNRQIFPYSLLQCTLIQAVAIENSRSDFRTALLARDSFHLGPEVHDVLVTLEPTQDGDDRKDALPSHVLLKVVHETSRRRNMASRRPGSPMVLEIIERRHKVQKLELRPQH